MSKDHYVPQTYLRYFCNSNNRLHTYNKQKNKFFLAAPKDVCHELDGDKNSLLKDTMLLGDFRKLFERHWNPAIKNMSLGKISEHDKWIISSFMTNVMTCTPAFLEGMKKLLTNKLLASIKHEEENTADSKKRLCCLQAIEFIENKKVDIGTHEYYKSISTQQLMSTTINIYNSDWNIFLNRCKNCFITSDNPVIILPSNGYAVYIFPLTPNLCLEVKCSIEIIKLEDLSHHIKKPPKGKIQATNCVNSEIINNLTFQNAQKLAFSSQKLSLLNS